MDIVLGEWSDTHSAVVNLDILKRTGLLVQASSGGGKSWLLRRLAEQLFGKMPVIIIDPEGEFSTLRERFDLVLVSAGEGADAVAAPSTAGALAHRLLELGCSAVCDLFELLPEQRHEWVANFLGALDNAPKRLWRDVAIITDEAHLFMPEKGEDPSPALGPMTAMATRGRKRGYLVANFTQRLAAIKKSGAAELKNVLVGKTMLDTDKERARKHLGISRRQREEFDNQLRKLQPGFFYGIGPAIGDEAALMMIGAVTTTHPEPGRRTTTPPPPTAAIRHLLPQLADLPKDASAEPVGPKANEEIGRLKAEVQRLTGELAIWERHCKKAEEDLRDHRKALDGVTANEVRRMRAQDSALDAFLKAVATAGKNVAYVAGQAPPRVLTPTIDAPRDTGPGATHTPTKKVLGVDKGRGDKVAANGVVLALGARRLLNVLVARGGVLTTSQLGVLCGMSPKGTTLGTYVSRLLAARLIERIGPKELQATQAGRTFVGEPAPLPTKRDLIAEWKAHKRLIGKAKDILEMVAVEKEIPIADIADRLSLERKGTTLETYVSRLLSVSVVSRGRGTLKIHQELAL
jgi:hypothetical protein